MKPAEFVRASAAGVAAREIDLDDGRLTPELIALIRRTFRGMHLLTYVTWCRRFRDWRPRRGVTMRQNRRPGEQLFVDYAGMTVPLLIDRVEHEAQVFVASMGVSRSNDWIETRWNTTPAIIARHRCLRSRSSPPGLCLRIADRALNHRRDAMTGPRDRSQKLIRR